MTSTIEVDVVGNARRAAAVEAPAYHIEPISLHHAI
jgi:hypothetical protein